MLKVFKGTSSFSRCYGFRLVFRSFSAFSAVSVVSSPTWYLGQVQRFAACSFRRGTGGSNKCTEAPSHQKSCQISLASRSSRKWYNIVFSTPSHLPMWCPLTLKQKVREAAVDLLGMQGLPLAEALDRVRNDQEHRMFHWVQLLMQPGQQRSLSAPAFSSELSKGAQPANQSSEVKTLASKVDNLASTVNFLRTYPSREEKEGTDPDLRNQRREIPMVVNGRDKERARKHSLSRN